MSQSDFRLPPEVVKSQFRKVTAYVALGVLASHLFISRGGLVSLASTALLLGGIVSACYIIAKRHVWVSLSSMGVSGIGYTGRRVSVRWSDATTVVPGITSGIKGVEVRASQNDGILNSKVLSLFVPEPILLSQSFKSSLHQLAPPGHPLREVVASAA